MASQVDSERRGPLTRGAEGALSALLAFDERLVRHHAPIHDAPQDPTVPPWAAEVRAAWPVVRRELDALLADQVHLPLTEELIGEPLGAEGRWTTFVMGWYGDWIESTCARCPETAAVLRGIPQVQIAAFTVLDAGTHIPRHQGPATGYRWQMGIRVPEPPGACRIQIGDEVITWADGVTLAFDDRTPHEAWNDSDEPRYVLFVQVPWPLGGWPGVLHRATQHLFGRATRRVARRADAMEQVLNGAGGGR